MQARARRRARRLFLEALETRWTLNADNDINADGGLSVLDALVIVNAVSGYDDGYSQETLDVNSDAVVDIGDVEAVIDAISASQFSSLAEGEGEYNSPPSASDDIYYMQHDSVLSDNVSSNDWDMEGDPLTFSLVSGTSNGTLSFGGGAFTYTPSALFEGTDSFVYSVSDGEYTVTATATIYVTNTAPNASDDIYYLQHDTTLSDNVSSNDWDMEADPLTFTLVSGPASGTLSFSGNGSFTYVPNALFAGTDTFMYSVSDGLVSTVASAMIYVTNTAPSVSSDSFYMTHDTTLNDNVSSNDWDMEADPLTFTLVTGPASGNVTLTNAGSFAYVPNPLFTGTDMFVYRVSDGIATTEGTAVIYVMNNAPMASADSYTTPANGTRKLIVASSGVLGNDTDSDPGDHVRLRSAIVSQPGHGSVTMDAFGGFTYEPTPGFVGHDSFTYKTTDQIDDSEPATVSIYVPRPVVSLSVVQGSNPAREKKEVDNDTDTAFVVSLPEGPVNFDITVPFVLAGQDPIQTGYATNNVDFTLSAASSVTIPAGSPQVVIDMVVLKDNLVEGSEHIAMTLQYPAGAPNFNLENHFASTNIQDNDYWKWDAPPAVAANQWIGWDTLDPSVGDAPWGFVVNPDEIISGDSEFMSGDEWIELRADGMSLSPGATWQWWEYYGLVFVQEHYDVLSRELVIDFDFDETTGQVRPRSGSGIEGSTQINDAALDIQWSYAIDNSSPLVKVATVVFHIYGGVAVNYTAGGSGGVNATGKIAPEDVGVEFSGSWNVSWSVTRTDGGTATSEGQTRQFFLRSTEDPDPE